MIKVQVFISCLFLLFSSNPVFAQIAVKAGDVIQEEGVFLTNKEAARILAEKKANDELCSANIAYEKEKVNSVCKLQIETLKLNLESEREKRGIQVQTCREEKDKLYKQIGENAADYSPYWFIAGTTTGALFASIASVAIFFAATQSDKANSLVE